MAIRIAALLALLLVAPGALAGYGLSPYVSYPTGSHAETAAVGDVNGDGRNDVVLTTGSYFDPSNDFHVFIFIQNPDGTLAQPHKVPYAEWNNRSSLVLADLDSDGRAEIIVGYSSGITVMKWGPFRGRVVSARYSTVVNSWDSPTGAHYLAVLDVDRDGHLDILAQSWTDGAAVFFGDGKGTISRNVKFPTPLGGWNDIKSGDFNGDGYRDVALRSGQGSTSMRVYVYYNDGTDDMSAPLEIVPEPAYWAADGLGAGDFDGDGRDDLVMQRDPASLWLFKQKSSGGFEAPAVLPTQSAVAIMVTHDVDMDGRQDLLAYHSGVFGIYLQTEEGLGAEFQAADLYGTFNSHGIDIGDINGDRCPDIVAANNGLGLVVFHGTGCNAVADLSTSVGMNATRVAVRIDNFGNAAAIDPEVAIVLSVANGNLALGKLPGGCALTAQTSLRAEVLCTQATLASQQSRTVILPLALTGGSLRNLLTVNAAANTPTLESRLDNNVVTATLRSWYAPAVQAQRTSAKPSRVRQAHRKQ